MEEVDEPIGHCRSPENRIVTRQLTLVVGIIKQRAGASSTEIPGPMSVLHSIS
jgi:hypothetical protein